MKAPNPLSMKVALALLAAVISSTSAPARAAPTDDPGSDVERQLKQAQEQLERSAREVADLSMRLNSQLRIDAKAWSGLAQQRAVLGLTIAGDSDERHGPGVRVVSVSPGGPADAAGIRANDAIVAFNGTVLEHGGGSPARQRLLALIHDTKAGAPVQVEYRRDGRTQMTSVTPKSVSMFIDESYLEGLEGLGAGLNHMAVSFGARGAGGFGSTEFLALDPGLGRYFGTDHGLLVVRAPKDARLKLEDGDVVLDIDGRIPSSVSHGYQILNSYRGGEVMKLHLMRQQKKIELPVEMPADLAEGTHGWPTWQGWPVSPLQPPAPPAPPAPPPARAPQAGAAES